MEAQALRRVDRLDAEIDRLELRLQGAEGSECLSIHDVQLWDGERITYKVGAVIDAPPEPQGVP